MGIISALLFVGGAVYDRALDALAEGEANMLRLDLQKVKEGVTIPYFEPNKDGSVPWVKLAYLGTANRRYQQRLDIITRPKRRQLAMGAVSEKEAAALYRKAFIECVLLDWGNIQPKDDGEVIPYSEENAELLLGNDEFIPFYEWMETEAKQNDNFKQVVLEQEVKN
jgi:hypothetical protein